MCKVFGFIMTFYFDIRLFGPGPVECAAYVLFFFAWKPSYLSSLVCVCTSAWIKKKSHCAQKYKCIGFIRHINSGAHLLAQYTIEQKTTMYFQHPSRTNKYILFRDGQIVGKG